MSTEHYIGEGCDELARSQYATFYVDEHLFGIDVTQVQEIMRYHEMTPVPLSSRIVQGLINLRGQIITAIDLRRRFGMEDCPEGNQPMNVVTHVEGETISLLVDRIGDVLEVENSRFERTPDTLKGVSQELVSGVYKLDRQLLLILDTKKTVDIRAVQ